jgi:hypothetical protein
MPIFQRLVLVKRKESCHILNMFKKILPIIVTGLFVCAVGLRAQDATNPDGTPADPTKKNDTPISIRFWKASLPGGHFQVPLDRIVSVSRHKYVLDGALIVDEVTVDTVGQALARFYFIKPITDSTSGNSVAGIVNRGRELVDKAAERVGTDAQNMVVKKYPDTTHAKCLEYRLLREEDLGALLGSVTTAWETGRGRQFSVK